MEFPVNECLVHDWFGRAISWWRSKSKLSSRKMMRASLATKLRPCNCREIEEHAEQGDIEWLRQHGRVYQAVEAR